MCDDSKRLQKPAAAANGGLGCRPSAVAHGGGGGGHHHHHHHNPTSYNIVVGSPLDQSMDIIDQQCQEIYDLRQQLNLVMNERDALLSEVGRLKFDMELYDQRLTMAQDTNSR